VAQQPPEAQKLELGNAVEREMAGGQAHAYRLTIAVGQYLHAVVDQRGIEVSVAIFDPDGKKLIEVDSPNGAKGPKPVSLVAEISGDYRLEVRSPDKGAASGRYEVTITELRTAVPQDASRLAAERAFAEAERLRGQGTAAALRQSTEKYAQAVQFRRSAGDKLDEAKTLEILGGVSYALSELPQALEYFNRALSLWRELGKRAEEGGLLSSIGAVYLSRGEPQQALTYLNQALQLRRAIGDQAGEATTLSNLGAAYSLLGEKHQALDYYNQALPIARAVGNRSKEATTLNNIGAVYESLGEAQQALNYFNHALPLLRALGERLEEGRTLGNIGNTYNLVGEPQQALDYLNQSLLLARTVGDRWEEATTLNNIGWVYESEREAQKALDQYGQALPLLRALGDRRREARTLKNIGAALLKINESQKALTYLEQAISLARAVGDHLTEAYILHDFGRAYDLLGEKPTALEFYHQSLQLVRAAGDRASEATTLYGMAHVERDRGNLDQARDQIEAALNIIESLRVQVISQELRASYLASKQSYYEFECDLLMRLHRRQPSQGLDALALEASERARARSLLETLTEARADIRQGVDPTLLDRERSLQQQLNAKDQIRMQLLARKHSPEQVAAAEQALRELATQYEEIQARIRVDSPRYAALTQPQPLKLKEIQEQLLDADTLLLEYAMGDERSYLWAVSSDSIASFELPKRAEIEAAAKSFHDLLTMRDQPSRAARPAQGERLSKGDTPLQTPGEAAANLSRMLLGPVTGRLGGKLLLIVADGALQYVPFAALPDPAAIVSKSEGLQPLVAAHEVVSLPSASTLAVLRREVAGRPAPPKSVAVLADPVFASDDLRVKRNQMVAEKRTTETAPNPTDARGIEPPLERSARESSALGAGPRLPRLPGTRREAADILALIPAGERKQALDFEASRATVTSPELAEYRIIHFATHGLLNSVHPGLSGIVLSLVDPQGQPQDGFLRMQEIYNLKLPADLVVLSACQTGLGKEIKGEGLVGLTRGFMYAGSPRVVASLWKVDDKATAELMKRFYQAMVGEHHLAPAAALQAAQVAMWRTKEWHAPYYWAAFVLQGEWK
jgi:CHAT domain-containing protein/tetratricopeptide (TPR) repeat protein